MQTAHSSNGPQPPGVQEELPGGVEAAGGVEVLASCPTVEVPVGSEVAAFV